MIVRNVSSREGSTIHCPNRVHGLPAPAPCLVVSDPRAGTTAVP